jgi:hypothetical protein
MHNLFGEEITPEQYCENDKRTFSGPFAQFRKRNCYRKSISKEQRCQICENIITKEYHCKRYFKCDLQGCSASEASDIRLSYVCNLFKRAEL